MLLQRHNNKFMDNFSQTQNNKKSKTWLVVLTIIVVLAVLAWFAYSYRTILIPSGGSESQLNKLESQGTSDEISEIEKDLNVTSLGDLNSEITDIERELQNTGY